MTDDEVMERIVRLETTVASLLEYRSELRGYLDGRVQSLDEDQRQLHHDIVARYDRVERLIYGNGNGSDSPGLPERIRRLERSQLVFHRIATAALTVLCIEAARGWFLD